MAELQPERAPSLPAQEDQPLIGVILQEDGQEVVRYFAEEAHADAALSEATHQDVLSLAGAWCDLDWLAMEDALDLIRHQRPPSSPISS